MIKKAISRTMLALLLTCVLSCTCNIDAVSGVSLSPHIRVVPEETVDPAIAPGMNYTVSIYTDYSGIDVWAWQFTLKFNSSILEGLQVSNGDLITTAKHSSATFLPGDFENTLGELSLTCAFFFYVSPPPPPPITSGPGTLAYITFRVIGYGSSDITLGQHTALFGPAQPPDYLLAYKIIAANQPPGRTSPPYGSDHIGNGLFDNRLQEVMAAADIDPDTLNLRSKNKWITAYIQLPEGYSASDIDASTVLLNGTIAPVLDPKYNFATNSSEYLVDSDNDGILERMVKFDRAAVGSFICSQEIRYGDVALTLTGALFDETPFEGTDTIKVLLPGDADDDGDVDFNDFIIFAGCYGIKTENPLYVPRVDFNEDGTIDFDDFTILAGNYGKTVI